jgi:putative oxidoreductase
MKKVIFHTNDAISPIFVRLLLAIVLFAHGAQKLLGWYGGFGFDGTMSYFTETVGLPWIIGFIVIIIEFFGPIFLVLGLATRIWSLGILIVMAGIIVTSFNKYFFMNWSNTQPEEGYEFFLLAIGMSLSLIVSGSGSWSVDKHLGRKNQSQKESHVSSRAALSA